MFVSAEASILHADLDSFYASVEQRDDPGLRGRPVIVGGGVVLAASYEAKAYGVRTAMGGAQARRLCPQAVVVPPRMAAYTRASDAVFEVFRDTSPLVEAISVDEAFIDVGGLRRVSGTPVEIAARLRSDVRSRVGLPITVGIARTKFLAKVASQEAKPDGLLLVPPGREIAFLHPLPVRRLWGVGAVTADKLHAHGIETVADVAELSESLLGSLVGGAMGGRLYALSHNVDQRRVATGVSSALGRGPAGAWSRGEHDVGGRDRRGGDRPDRPDRGPDARRWAHRPDSDIAVAVQRLWPGHPVAHIAVGDLLDACPARHRAAAGRGRRPADRRAGSDAGRVRRFRDRPRRRRATDVAAHQRGRTRLRRRGGRSGSSPLWEVGAHPRRFGWPRPRPGDAPPTRLMQSWHHLGLRGMSPCDHHTRARVRLREQVRKVDERPQGREQRDFDAGYEVVWHQCRVGRRRIEDRGKEVTGLHLIRDNVRVPRGETGEQVLNCVGKGGQRGNVVRERAADVAHDLCRRRAERHVGNREADELEQTIDDVTKRRVLGGDANRVQRFFERLQRRDLVLVTDRILQIFEGVGDALVPAVTQCVGELRVVDIGG